MRIGYFLSSEEFDPRELVTQARMAEAAGFQGLWISDHYHPWNDQQGHSGFVWSTIGTLAQATSTMNVMTAVTCPTVRIHPAVIAQAAATCAVLLEGRFVLGPGSGEALNEHILGDRWPRANERLHPADRLRPRALLRGLRQRDPAALQTTAEAPPQHSHRPQYERTQDTHLIMKNQKLTGGK